MLMQIIILYFKCRAVSQCDNMLTCMGKSKLCSNSCKVNKDLKVIELKGIRDLFGRLLHLSTVQNVDLENVFAYPLTHVTLVHIDMIEALRKQIKQGYSTKWKLWLTALLPLV